MPQHDDQAHADDAARITVDTGFQPKRKAYKVTAMGGLFKNGKQIDKGQLVELDDRTAANFKAAGDIDQNDEGEELTENEK